MLTSQEARMTSILGRGSMSIYNYTETQKKDVTKI